MYIWLKNKSLIFKTWIRSGIIFVNDVINHEGNIEHNVIYAKLINKSDWITETEKLKKKSVPSDSQNKL